MRMTREAAWRVHAFIGVLTLLAAIVSWPPKAPFRPGIR